MPKIKALSPKLINQIAAGEVIERPASVVKECLENSIDAGATEIQINIEKGGKQLIRIRDNGCGIEREDLNLALTSHATSKLSSVDDLQCIGSLGFRGEALASISAIARLLLTSKAENAEQAWQVRSEGQQQAAVVTPAAHPKGTTIEVKDLFFNIPARRKFLRGERTEFLHIEELVKRIALSQPKLSLKLTHNNKKILQLNSATSEAELEARVSKVCGAQFMQQAILIDNTEVSGLRLSGWIGNAEFSRSQNDLQYFFINGRMVRDKLLMHAARQAYAEVLYPGRHPAYVLYLEMDGHEVDVNVHPTKHEVRFHEARLIHDFIVTSLSEKLGVEEQIKNNSWQVQQQVVPIKPAIALAENNSSPASIAMGNQLSPSSLFAVCTDDESKGNSSFIIAEEAFVPNNTELVETIKLPGEVIGQLQQRYILLEHQHGLLVFDMHKINYQLTLAKLNVETTILASKPLLLPQTINLRDVEFDALNQQTAILKQLGFDFMLSGDKQIVLQRIPCLIPAKDCTQLIKDLLTISSNSLFRKNSSTLSSSAKAEDPEALDGRSGLSVCTDNDEGGEPTISRAGLSEVKRFDKPKHLLAAFSADDIPALGRTELSDYLQTAYSLLGDLLRHKQLYKAYDVAKDFC